MQNTRDLKHGKFDLLQSFALSLGNDLLDAKARELGQFATHELPTSPDKKIVCELESAWSSIYGQDKNNWPEEVVLAIESIRTSIGLLSFNNALICALQNLKLSFETLPAFEAGVDIVGGPLRGSPTEFALIPDNAARAGLQFITNPLNLVLPIWAGGVIGKFAVGLTRSLTASGGIVAESGAALAATTGLLGEATGFVGANNVIHRVAEGFSPPSDSWNPEGFRYAVQELGASTLFFGGLKMFGGLGRFAASLLGGSEAAIGMATIIGHIASITGLASMEEIQELAGIAPANSETFYERLWRAAFLHTTIQAVNGVINLTNLPQASRYMATDKPNARYVQTAKNPGKSSPVNDLLDAKFLNIGLLRLATEPFKTKVFRGLSREFSSFIAAVVREHTKLISNDRENITTEDRVSRLLLRYLLFIRRAGFEIRSKSGFAGFFAAMELAYGTDKKGLSQVETVAITIFSRLETQSKKERISTLSDLIAAEEARFDPGFINDMIKSAKALSIVIERHIARAVLDGLLEKSVAIEEFGISPEILAEEGASFDIENIAYYATTNGTVVIIDPGMELESQLQTLAPLTRKIIIIESSPQKCDDLRDKITALDYGSKVQVIEGDATEDTTWQNISANLIISHFALAEFGAAAKHLNAGGMILATVPGRLSESGAMKGIGIKAEEYLTLDAFYYGIPLVKTFSSLANPACVTSLVVRRGGSVPHIDEDFGFEDPRAMSDQTTDELIAPEPSKRGANSWLAEWNGIVTSSAGMLTDPNTFSRLNQQLLRGYVTGLTANDLMEFVKHNLTFSSSSIVLDMNLALAIPGWIKAMDDTELARLHYSVHEDYLYISLFSEKTGPWMKNVLEILEERVKDKNNEHQNNEIWWVPFLDHDRLIRLSTSRVLSFTSSGFGNNSRLTPAIGEHISSWEKNGRLEYIIDFLNAMPDDLHASEANNLTRFLDDVISLGFKSHDERIGVSNIIENATHERFESEDSVKILDRFVEKLRTPPPKDSGDHPPAATSQDSGATDNTSGPTTAGPAPKTQSAKSIVTQLMDSAVSFYVQISQLIVSAVWLTSGGLFMNSFADFRSNPPDPEIGARNDAAMDDLQQLGETAKRSSVAAVMLRDLFVQKSNITTLRLLIHAAEVNADAADVLLGLAENNRVVFEMVKTEMNPQTMGAAAKVNNRLVTSLENLHKMGVPNTWKGLAIAATQNMYAVYVLGQIASPNTGEAHAALMSMGPKVVFDKAMKLDRWGMNAAWTILAHKNTDLLKMFRAAKIDEVIQNAEQGSAEASLLFLLHGAKHPQAIEAARRSNMDSLAALAARGDTELVFIMDDYRSIGNVNAQGKMASINIAALISPPDGSTPSLSNIEALKMLARNGNRAAEEALIDLDIKPFLLNRAPILKIPLIRLAEAGNIDAMEEVAKMLEEKVIIKDEKIRVITRHFRPIYEDVDIARSVREIHLDALKAYSLTKVRGVRLLARLAKLGIRQASEILFNLSMEGYTELAREGDSNALEALTIGTRAANWRALNGIVLTIKGGATELIQRKAMQTLETLVLEGIQIAIRTYYSQFPGRPIKRRH